MIEMSVKGIGLDARNSQPIVILNDATNERALPIWIGVSEARAISLALEGVKSQRPLTHDLLLNVIERLGYTVTQIEIDRLNDTTYCSTIRLVLRDGIGLGEKLIDARPSDAIALALAVRAPIYVSPDVVSNSTIIWSRGKSDDAHSEAEFKRFVEGVKASDFNLPGVSVSTTEDEEESASGSEDAPTKAEEEAERSGDVDPESTDDEKGSTE